MTDLFCIRAHAAFVKAAVDLAMIAGHKRPGPDERLEQVREWHVATIVEVAEAAGLNTFGLVPLLMGDWAAIGELADIELEAYAEFEAAE